MNMLSEGIGLLILWVGASRIEMVAAATIENSDEKIGVLKQFFRILFYPVLYVFRLFFKKSKNAPAQNKPATNGSQVRASSTSSASQDPEEIWSNLRLQICERLWGDGTLNPITSDYMISTLRLLGVDETNSLLQLGAGLGGTTRSMVDQIGIWITGFEVDEGLLKIAKVRNKMTGLSKKAAISRLRPEAPKFKANGFNAALIYECLASIENKEVIINDVANSLRENGHFIMIDYVLPSADPPNAAVMSWYNFEPEKPKLWTARRTYDTIKDAGLDVRIAEDFTATYRNMVLTSWLKLLSGLSKKDLTPEFAAVLIKECEYWIYRIAALDSGGLKVYRYHALKE